MRTGQKDRDEGQHNLLGPAEVDGSNSSEAGTTNEQLEQVRKELKQLSSILNQLGKVRSGDPTFATKVIAAFAKMPTPESVHQAYTHAYERLLNIQKKIRKERSSAFRKSEARFIADQKRLAPQSVREKGDRWRVGWIEIETKRDEGLARALYNGQVVKDWVEVSSEADLQSLHDDAKRTLEESEWSADVRSEVLLSAYYHLHNMVGQSKNKTTSDLVSLRDFYQEVRVALTRAELSSGKPTKRLKASIEVPVWQFLFNLDRYLAESPTGGPRLRLQTASQAEQKRVGHFTIGGLRPGADYQTFSYVRLAPDTE